jgi:hypothetical protein
MKDDITRMAREANMPSCLATHPVALERFANLVRADERDRATRENAYVQAEREACARVCEEFARKWWKIHCDSNLHYSSTLKAHQDFCALQAAIRARGQS